MSIQSRIIRNRRLATWFMSTMKASFWEKQGAKKVLKRFRKICKRVPAYQKLLKEKNINPGSINAIKDYEKLPILDKKNYLEKYEIKELCLDGKLYDKYLIDRSSGYSGTSFFWPRLIEEDADYPAYMKLAYEQFYQIDEKSTLMIITLSLGTWVGGEKISWATREIAISGKHPFTVITPGPNIDEVLEIVKFFKLKYNQIVIVGYPPFIKSVIDEGQRRGIDWKSFKLKIGLGGEGYSEDWREYIRNKIGMAENDFMGIAGGYGAADLGMSVGREYPISVLIRKLANHNKAMARDLFGEESIPSLCQYNPATFYIEEVKKELIFSCQAGIPLVRYNIHDRGGIIPFTRAIKIVRTYGYDPIKLLLDRGYTLRDIWRLPFFFVYGRSDGTISIDGANVYPENVETALFQIAEIRMINSFKLQKAIDDKFNERVKILIELRKDNETSDKQKRIKIQDKFHRILLAKLLEINSDYKESYLHNPQSADFEVIVYNYKEGPFFKDISSIKIAKVV